MNNAAQIVTQTYSPAHLAPKSQSKFTRGLWPRVALVFLPRHPARRRADLAAPPRIGPFYGPFHDFTPGSLQRLSVFRSETMFTPSLRLLQHTEVYL